MSSSNNTIKLKNLAALMSICVATLLSLVKALAFFYTGSLSVLSSMVDSLADVISSLITYIAVRISDKPLNEKHRYGYGKAEAVSALLQAAFIAGSAGFILYDGIKRFIYPVTVEQTIVGMAIMCFSLFSTLVLVIFQRHVVKKTNSKAIDADSAHYTVDILSNSSVILSLLVVRYLQWQWFDVLTALLIAFYLSANALRLAYDALNEITDAEVDDNTKKHIINIIQTVANVKGYHDLRTRVAGAHMFIEIHLELDGNLSLFTTHAIADEVEHKIVAAFPQAQVIIHQDPYGIYENRLDNQIKTL